MVEIDPKVMYKVPKCCDECPLYDDRWDYPTCYFTDESRGYNFDIHNKRMPGCPLIEKSFVPWEGEDDDD